MSVLAQIPMLLPSWVKELSTITLVLAGVVGLPILAIVLNVLRQVRVSLGRRTQIGQR
jgi:sterol 14-demethylase